MKMKHIRQEIEGYGNMRRSLIVLIICYCLPFGRVSAQVIDENTPATTTFSAVGELGRDFIAQSFIANIVQCQEIGVWLRRDSGGGEVRLALVADNGLNQPDILSGVLHESALIVPSSGGAWAYDSGFTAILIPGEKYWVVVDGHNNFQTTGYSSVGVSNVFTDSFQPLFYSDNSGGQYWDSLPAVPMAVYVAGDTCMVGLQILPAIPIVCPGETVELTVPTGFLSYSWSNGNTGSVNTVNSFGNFSVTVTDQNNCVGIASTTVLLGSVPGLNLDTLYTFCEGEDLTLAVNPFFNEYLWSTGATSTAILITEPGDYWVSVTSAAGCARSDTTRVELYPRPNLSLGEDQNLCLGEFTQLDAGPDFIFYSWSTGALTRSIFIDATTTASVLIQDSNYCWANSDTVTITVHPLPGAPSIMQDFSGLNSSFGFAYHWILDGDTLIAESGQTIAEPQPGLYQVVVENAFGCKAVSDTFTVTSTEVGNFISEGFSPNGDGLNEVFVIEGIGRYPDNLLLIFNRWGEQVYRKKVYQNDWQGIGPGGKSLPDGNYFYIIDFGNGDEARKGVVMINR